VPCAAIAKECPTPPLPGRSAARARSARAEGYEATDGESRAAARPDKDSPGNAAACPDVGATCIGDLGGDRQVGWTWRLDPEDWQFWDSTLRGILDREQELEGGRRGYVTD
jgi:hypothetical protein